MTEKKIALPDVEQVAGLARLGLSSGDKEKLVSQLNDILVYMEKLDELDTSEIKPLAHILPLENVLRDDEERAGLEREVALKNAPEERNGFFIVPPVIG